MSASPADDPLAWIQIGIGVYTFPLERGQGTAKVKVKSSQKLDEQKAAGKNKAKLKQSGTDPCPVTIDLEWRKRCGPSGEDVIWPLVEMILNSIDPNGPNGGGPFEFRHPDANRRGIKSIMIKEVGEVAWQAGGWIGKCAITAVEWEIPKKAAAGVGTKTPTDPQQWVDATALDLTDPSTIGPYLESVTKQALNGGLQPGSSSAPDASP